MVGQQADSNSQFSAQQRGRHGPVFVGEGNERESSGGIHTHVMSSVGQVRLRLVCSVRLAVEPDQVKMAEGAISVASFDRSIDQTVLFISSKGVRVAGVRSYICMYVCPDVLPWQHRRRVLFVRGLVVSGGMDGDQMTKSCPF